MIKSITINTEKSEATIIVSLTEARASSSGNTESVCLVNNQDTTAKIGAKPLKISLNLYHKLPKTK